RDNMKFYAEQLVQRGHNYAIVDEVDSILIDEARTPLIISGASDESTALYPAIDAIVCQLKKDAHFTVDEKAKSAMLTDEGVSMCEELLHIDNLFDPASISYQHHILQSLKAHHCFRRDVDYVLQDGKVVIVDEFTGRLMPGRRFSDGLHQALEAKEHVQVEAENQTLASITFQNYFRMYDKLSGMTGTAATEQEEFVSIYGLDIIEIPTNKPVARIDRPDVVYKNENGKNRAIIQQIVECHEKGQPVLVGTVSIEKSEYISKLLQRTGIQHSVLNAKNHEKEAEIVAQAGKFGAVTIATNMAGRGTDITLGGNAEFLAKNDLKKAGYSDEVIVEATGYADTDNADILAARQLFAERMKAHKAVTGAEAEKVRAAGGLFILGTERHESRRIDNQLRGRSGRQGDPGESRFFISMTDDIMRLFGSERVMGMMETLGLEEDTPLDNKMLSNAIEQAQKTVESRNFQTRKATLEYDDVMNVQRKLIYEQRYKVLDGEDVRESIRGMIAEFITDNVGTVDPDSPEALEDMLNPFYPLFLPQGAIAWEKGLKHDAVRETVERYATEAYEKKEAGLGAGPDGTPLMRELERVVLLRVVDEYWMDHIDAMAELRKGIGLRGYGNVKPVDAYKQEGFEMFEQMVAGIRQEVSRRMYLVRVRTNETVQRKSVVKNPVANAGGDGTVKRQPVRREKKPGRNDPCPCGKLRPNGLPMKYKDCCGRNA
ncbi:MAG: preprotein translocase subunit SecA, partial [Oscillospiraceae bacterium]|nr:preprotein translocase subunit SecA [Oscillospiraceae bacterium]